MLLTCLTTHTKNWFWGSFSCWFIVGIKCNKNEQQSRIVIYGVWRSEKYCTATIHNYHHYHCINQHFINTFIEAVGLTLKLVLQV